MKSKIINNFQLKLGRLTKEMLQISPGIEQQYTDLLDTFNHYVNHGVPYANSFDFDEYAVAVFSFVSELQGNGPFAYRYAESTPEDTIYGSVYACMLYFLLNKQDFLTADNKKEWVEYFNKFQNDEGLFIDPRLECDNYYKIDWWGANHLSLHLIICYTYLNAKPKNEFNYIKRLYSSESLINYMKGLDFDSIIYTDADNAIMNLGVLLQYQRDYFNDDKAGAALNILFEELEKRINPKWGSWGYGKDDDMQYLSRTQQFAYHLYPLWLYDNRPIRYKEQLIDLSLKTQTILGGFGPFLNSSACEDIDCIDLLIKLSDKTDYRREDIEKALKKSFAWVLTNQNSDGGFVFRRNEPFVYGHTLTSSLKNESNLFATWFRTLSIAYLARFLKLNGQFNVGRCPGLQFLK